MELWKDIPGYEGIYQASTLGNIRSAPCKTTSNSRFENRMWATRIIKPKKESRGGIKSNVDLRVSLWKDGKHSDHLVARLVAITWCPGFSDGKTVNHIDGNTLNNNIENLEWLSLSENIRRAFDDGLYDSIMKKVKLTDSNGCFIEFRSMAEASRYLGRNNGYISNRLKKGKRNAMDSFGKEFCISEF